MIAERVDLTQTRLQVYELLASCVLSEPTGDSLAAAGTLFSHLLPALQLPVPDLAAVQQEYYDRLFVPMSGRYVPPFESAIRGRTVRKGGRPGYGPLMGPAACEVGAAYAAVGFDPAVLTMYEPIRGLRMPDFLGFELAFMAFLVKEQAAAEASGATEQAQRWHSLQRQFLEEHLTGWTADLATLAGEAGPGFYAELYQAIHAWATSDLGEMIAPFEGGM
ncbi:MAG TPA: molecular chaperone TorD family protein [Symbiobacteriaceae bacterium]|nr:molecular chaperone TorD family protein [Symbiobacteriaceae bacterium]